MKRASFQSAKRRILGLIGVQILFCYHCKQLWFPTRCFSRIESPTCSSLISRLQRRASSNSDAASAGNNQHQSQGLGDSSEKVFALPEPASQTEISRNAGTGSGASLQIPLHDKFGLAYTCGRCEARNVIQVTRVAWKSGVVVATCRGCKVRHLLADNGGLLDLTHERGFNNVVEFIEAQGNTITKLDWNDKEALQAFNLTVGNDGKIKLSDEELDEDTAADSPDDADMPDEQSEAQSAGFANQASDESDIATSEPATHAGSSTPEEIDAAPLIIRLGADVRMGDVLTVDTEFGDLHVPVPSGAFGGCKLEVQGMVEVELGDFERWVQNDGVGEWQQSTEWKVGDTVAVNMPEGQVARIRVPESAAKDALLLIAYPVVVLHGNG